MLIKNQIFYIWLLVVFFITGGLSSCVEIITNIEVYTYEPKYEGINYQTDEASIYTDVCDDPNTGTLKITEISTFWLELYNSDATKTVCLENYQLRATIKNGNTVISYPFSKLSVEPQSYFIVRFEGNSDNNSKDIEIINGPGVKEANGYYSGAFELLLSGVSVDYVAFCSDENKSRPFEPTTGIFSDCLSYNDTKSAYGSFSLDVNHTDNNSYTDWTFRNMVTFGGKNDVIDETDNDEDGVPDANEQRGTTFAGMPLYDWGARVNQKDIFVFINYMDGGDYTNADGVFIKEGLVPFKESFESIKTVFHDNGYEIHFDLGNTHSKTFSPSSFNLSTLNHEVPYAVYTDLFESPVSSDATPNATSVILYKNRYMPINRFGIFHYSLLANSISYQGTRENDTLGIAELPGNDFILFLGGDDYYNVNTSSSLYKQNYLAKVFMHELGHNLKLRHGGDENNNYKPNYFSIMNYGYTFNGVPTTSDSSSENFFNRYLIMSGLGTPPFTIKNSSASEGFNMNFSHGTMPDLNENDLTEINPLGQGLGNIDWNYDSNLSNNISYNLNPEYNDGKTQLQVLRDYNDWDNLLLPFDHTITHNGYGNLELPTKATVFMELNTGTGNSAKVNFSSSPTGSQLIGVEGTSPYIIDRFPKHYNKYRNN